MVESSFPHSPMIDDKLSAQTIGDYKIVRLIGCGAMAQVYLAIQKSLNRSVALKILRKELASDQTYIRRFIQEAQAAAQLEHHNIVRIYDVGVFEYNGDSLHYIAQEFIAGMNLQHYLKRCGSLSISQSLLILLQISSALEQAAQLGIVHRDIKPENILLSETGTIKVADFGLAYCQSFSNAASLSLTQIGVTLGTPLYMSPEQAEGKNLDFRSDIYSLGITGFQMLTGKPPFSGETPLSVVLQHLNNDPPFVQSLRKDIPDQLAAIIQKMIAKKPDSRFASFKELIVALKTARLSYLQSVSPNNDIVLLNEINEIDQNNDVFFDNDNDNNLFQKSLVLANLTQQIQTNLTQLQTVQQNELFSLKLLMKHKKTVWGLFAFLFIISLFISFWGRQKTSFVEPPLSQSIQRFPTVEEQWVFATQLGTIDAWKSVIEYYPDAEYWKRRAQQQLARVYVIENDVAEAQSIFEEFANMSPENRPFYYFGQVGMAWIQVQTGKTDAAAALLSDLRTQSSVPFDRLTEDLFSKTQELIRNRHKSSGLSSQ
ncbi:MAG: serine/threonine-protein kinase [Planctomycetia bacterium]|nr:serine/threonine-protein kinase [Planctomycetia bacterium]